MRLARITAVVAAGMLFVAACGGGDDETGGDGGGSAPAPVATEVDARAFEPGPPNGWAANGFTVDPASLQCAGATADPTRGITDTEITVGGLASLTAPGGAALAGAEVGAEVRFARANDEGGVNGRKINYIGTKDDGTDPARNVQEAQGLALRDRVFAVVPAITAIANFADVMCQEGIPYFGWGTNTAMCANALGFAITGCLLQTEEKAIPSNAAMLSRIVVGGSDGKSAAVLGSDNDSARAGVEVYKRTLELAGFDVVYAEASVPTAGLTDATPIVNAIMTADDGAPPDLMILSLSFPATLRATEALRAAGYPGTIVNQVGYDPRLATFEAFRDSITFLQWAPTESDSPGMRQLKEDFAKYAPDAVLSLPVLAGYWSADFFLHALEAAGPDVTADSLVAMLNAGDYSYEVPGAVAESRWPVNHNIAVPCGSAVTVGESGFEVIQELACGALVPTG
ncbi:MAG: ABC transporter substrate-binding protein [Frankia sp.]|nr:ABC transporter substrate-binding protein [Frankia sp.]